jgi:hypothetical protein
MTRLKATVLYVFQYSDVFKDSNFPISLHADLWQFGGIYRVAQKERMFFGTKFLIARYTPDAWRMRARPKKV